LVDRSNDLSAQSKMFYKQAKKTNSCCVISWSAWRQNWKAAISCVSLESNQWLELYLFYGWDESFCVI
jgi:DNA polymerase IIIc chi subunit